MPEGSPLKSTEKMDKPITVLPDFRMEAPPKGSIDNLIIRRNVDAFVRPYDPKSFVIDYGYQNPFQKQLEIPLNPYDIDLLGDEEVRMIICERPSLLPAVQATVKIHVFWRSAGGQLLEATGSGFLVGKVHVFTVLHIFEPKEGLALESIQVDIFFPCRQRVRAKQLELDVDLLGLIRPECLSSYPGTFWRVHPIDFAVLELSEVICDAQYLKIPDARIMSLGSTVAALGYPGLNSEVDYADCYIEYFLSYLKAHHPMSTCLQMLLQSFFTSTVNYFESPIIAFGALKLNPDPQKWNYTEGTTSATFGMSGGPVVFARQPDVLAGLVVGAHTTSACLYLDAYCPIVRMAFEIVKERERHKIGS